MVKNRDKHSKRKGVIVIDDQVIDSEEGQETSHLQKKGENPPSNTRKRQRLSRNRNPSQHKDGSVSNEQTRTNKKRRTSTSGTPSPEPKIVPKFGKRKQRDHDNTTLGAEIGTRQETRKEDSDAGQKSSLCKDEPTPSQIHPHPDIQEMGERSDDQQKDAVMESLSISTQDQNTENCVAEDKVCTMPSGESDNAELGQVESDVNQSMASEITEIVDEGKRHDRLDLQLGLSKDEDASDVVTPGDSCKQGNSRRNLSTTAKEETSSDEVVTAKSDDKEDHYRPDAERTPTCDVSLQKNGTSLISHSEHAEKASSFKIAKDSNMLPGFVSKENDDTHKENNTQHENTGRNSHTPADRNSDQFDMDEFAEKLNEHHEPKIKAGNSSELLFSVEEKNGNTDLVQTDGKSQMNGTSTEDVNRLKPDDAPVCEQGEHTLDQSISNEGDERKMKEYDGNTERSNEIVGGHHPYDILDCTQPFEIAGLDALSTNSPTTNITAADLSINDEISSKKTDENDLVDINKESAVTTGNEATVCDNSSSSKVASKSVTEDGSGSVVLIPLPPQEKASTEKDNSASTTNLAAKCVRDGEIEVKKPTFDGEPSSDQTKDSAVDIEEAPQFCLSASGDGDQLVGEMMDFTDSQMMELEEQCNLKTRSKQSCSGSSVAGGDGDRFEDKAIQTDNTGSAQDDRTTEVQGMIRELQHLNSTILDIKKQIESFRRQRHESTVPGASNQQQRNNFSTSPWRKRPYHR